MQKEKSLKSVSALFILLGIFDLVKLAMNFFSGEMTSALNAGDVSAEIAKVALIVLAVFVVILAAIKMLIGLKGLNYANGKTEKTGFITFMKVVFVVLVVELVLTFLGKNGVDYQSVIKSVVNIVIVITFIKLASDVKASRN